MGLADQRLELEGPALAGRPAGAGGTAGDTAGAVALLDHGIPLAAALAFALPAGRSGAAVLADVGQVAAGHGDPWRIRPVSDAGTLAIAGEHFKNIN
jgi:hypothetical protein